MGKENKYRGPMARSVLHETLMNIGGGEQSDRAGVRLNYRLLLGGGTTQTLWQTILCIKLFWFPRQPLNINGRHFFLRLS